VAPTANYTLDGIRQFMTQNPQQPFCLFVCSTLPHAPWTVGDAAHFPPAKLVLPPIWPDTPELRAAFSKYCAEVEALDQQVGAVLKALEESGAAPNTLVIFGGEQGAQFPGEKWTLFAPGVNSALLARWPGRIKAGTVSDALMHYEDVLPTLIAAAGGTPPAEIDGRSFLPVLTGEKSAHRDFIFGIHNNVPEGRPYPIRSIRSRDYKLILNLASQQPYHEKHVMDIDRENYWKATAAAAARDPAVARPLDRYLKRPPVELYAVNKDPWELENLADCPDLATIRRELEEKLRTWMRKQGDAGAVLDVEQPQPAKKKQKKGKSP
jgi:arylsulfatase A-like enzyme